MNFAPSQSDVCRSGFVLLCGSLSLLLKRSPATLWRGIFEPVNLRDVRMVQ